MPNLFTSSVFPLVFLLLLLLLLLLPLFSCLPHIRHNPHRYLSLPSCQAPLFVIAKPSSPQSLSYFLSQFPNSLPQKICFLFSAPFRYPHQHPSLVLTPAASISTLALTALGANPSHILVLTDQTYLHTVYYGTGKDDVSIIPPSSLLQKLLNFSTAHLLHADDPASVLAGRSVFSRGTPWQNFIRSGATPSANISALPAIRTTPLRFPIVHYVQQVVNLDPLFRGVAAAIAHPLSDILPSDTNNDGERVAAVALGKKELAPLPATPVLYARSAFWALAPLWCGGEGVYDAVVRGYVVQRVLQVMGKGVLFVRGVMEVWGGDEGEDVDLRLVAEENVRLRRVIERLKSMDVPRNMDARRMFLHFVRGLATEGLVSWCGVRAAARFLSVTERMDVVEKSEAVVGERENGIDDRLARTAVCITGQMRSAPFTAASIRRALRTGVGHYEVLIVTEQDDRVGSVSLFQPYVVSYSRTRPRHRVWIARLLNSTVLHETMSTERQLRNYLMQLADMRDCLELVQKRELERGKRFDYLIRMRPDTVLIGGVDTSWWAQVRAVVHGTRQAYYGMNDRFFAGERSLMGRLLSCHDLFWLLVGKGAVYHRKAGDATHMLWKKKINSERFLARCAAFKQVPMKPMRVIDARRVAYSDGVARWREF